jgi:hypothetical protein
VKFRIYKLHRELIFYRRVKNAIFETSRRKKEFLSGQFQKEHPFSNQKNALPSVTN